MNSSTETTLFSGIKFDRGFIKNLLEKLKIGNARSIHLNVVPGRSATRLDLFALAEIDPEIPEKFIEELITKENFVFKITFDSLDLGKMDEDTKKRLSLIARRLNNIVIENNDNFLEFGLKNFGFGYPILIKRDKKDPDKIIKAPLFIWDLDIERSFQNKNTWLIKKNEDFPIKVNELLISHIARDESIHLEKLPKEILEDGVLNKDELLDLTIKILAQLNLPDLKLESKIEKCLDSKEIEDIANNKPWIQWSGIFGIYRSQKETIIHATEELLERLDDFIGQSLVLEKFQTSTISAIETDPSQEEIVNTLSKDEIKLIQGPPGTGKSQSITAIIANTLANNGRCLVVCEKKTALDVIQANLDKLGIGSYSTLIDDVNKDRKKVIEKARAIKELSGRSLFSNYSQFEFKSKYEEFLRLKNEINSKHSEIIKKILGEYSFKQLIGYYLKYSKTEDFNKISSVLNYDILKFTQDEYLVYKSIVEEASYLYRALDKDSEKILSELRDSLFEQKYKWIENEKLNKNATGIYKLLSEISTFLSQKKSKDFVEANVSIFDTKSIEDSRKIVSKIIINLNEIMKLHTRGIKLTGVVFNKKDFIHDLRYHLLSPFSAKNREVFNTRRTIWTLVVDTKKLIDGLKRYNLGKFDIKKMGDYKSFLEVSNATSVLLKQFNKVEERLEELERTKIKLTKLESDLEKINKLEYFKLKNENFVNFESFENLKTFYSMQKIKFREIIDHLGRYENYHNWRFYFNNKNKFQAKLINAFREIPEETWKSIFEAWYFKGTIIHYEAESSVGFNKSDSQLERLSRLYNDLKRDQLKQIKSEWDRNRDNKILSSSVNFNTLYNFRRNNFGPKNSLRKIIDTDFELFTTLFPVILTNPSVVNAIFPLKQGLFKIVIFDEASQLRISDTFTSLIRGQFKIIAGDEHQMPPSSYFESTSDFMDIEGNETEEAYNEKDEQRELSESESLLQYASNLQDKLRNKSYLDFHYRSRHPALINFSNAAFYGGNLVPFPPTEVYKPIEFIEVNGVYESRTNPDEVVEVIKILKDKIALGSRGRYPSIAIATFNINQRNLIIDALNEASTKDGVFAEKLNMLREEGLFVKNLENIQGDEKDIVILSTTYGVNPDGSFSQNFARLNRIEGYKLLNVLITRAKSKIYVCTSIPKEKYLNFQDLIQSGGNNRRGILYAYLAYAKAVSESNTKLANDILKVLEKNSYEKPRELVYENGLSESPFEDEVYQELLKHFNKENIIQQLWIGGFRLDFLIKTKKVNFILECDGKTYHQAEEAYAYDMFRQKHLESMGYDVYRIWSANWFENKEREIKKLVEFVKLNSG